MDPRGIKIACNISKGSGTRGGGGGKTSEVEGGRGAEEERGRLMIDPNRPH